MFAQNTLISFHTEAFVKTEVGSTVVIILQCSPDDRVVLAWMTRQKLATAKVKRRLEHRSELSDENKL